MRATWNGTVVAESDATVVVEGNHYFPPDAIKAEFFRPSDTVTTCAWKGAASYADIVIGDDVNFDAAWCYPSPKPEAQAITGYWAFWKGVEVS
ncbi:MAG: hypothetical protein RJB01_797 [Actinomycetota bacterium]